MKRQGSQYGCPAHAWDGGTAPFYAYGVINDQANSDGSFVSAVRESSLEGTVGQTLPVIVETNVFTSELMVTNFSEVPKTVRFRFRAEAVQTPGKTATVKWTFRPGRQVIVPDIVNMMRNMGTPGIGPTCLAPPSTRALTPTQNAASPLHHPGGYPLGPGHCVGKGAILDEGRDQGSVEGVAGPDADVAGCHPDGWLVGKGFLHGLVGRPVRAHLEDHGAGSGFQHALGYLPAVAPGGPDSQLFQRAHHHLGLGPQLPHLLGLGLAGPAETGIQHPSPDRGPPKAFNKSRTWGSTATGI